MAGPVDKYRAAQRRLRRIFDAYTAELCPVCPEPCCRKPTKVREFDVLLANACGCSLPSANQAAEELAEAAVGVLTGRMEEERQPEPCAYLESGGCAFPGDLRPFECVRYVCPFLRKRMAAHEMREVRDLLHRLGVLYRELMDSAGSGSCA